MLDKGLKEGMVLTYLIENGDPSKYNFLALLEIFYANVYLKEKFMFSY